MYKDISKHNRRRFPSTRPYGICGGFLQNLLRVSQRCLVTGYNGLSVPLLRTVDLESCGFVHPFVRCLTSIILALSISGCVEKPEILEAITAKEKTTISVVIKEVTSEPILEMERTTVDTVKVTTGFLTKIPLAGGGWSTEGNGHEYTLKKTKTSWTITSEGGWNT